MCVSNKVRFRKILCIQTEPNVERGPSPSTSWGACRQTSRFVVGWQLSLAAGADAVMGKRLVGMSKCLLRAWGLILPGSSPAPLGLGAANTALPSSTPPAPTDQHAPARRACPLGCSVHSEAHRVPRGLGGSALGLIYHPTLLS